MDEKKLVGSKQGLVPTTEGNGGLKRASREPMSILPIRPGEMLRTIPSFHGAERLATAVERIDRQVVDELLHLLGQLRERTGRPTPVVQIAGVEGGEGASTISALLGRIAADVSRGAVLLFSDLQPSGAEEAALAPLPSSARSSNAQTNTVGVEGEVYVCSLSALRSLKPHNRDPAERSTAELIEMLREHFVLILIDSGPVMGSIDHLRDIRSFDGVLLVIHADRTSIPKAKSAAKRLIGAGGNILGTIVNRERRLLPPVFSPQR